MSDTKSIELGPFRLQESIGHGAMGEVWRGVHVGQGVPVAVKVLSREVVREERYRIAFRNEVQAVAGLNHPGVVMVLEHGQIPMKVALATSGKLSAGSPYLVMELASGGSLDESPMPMSWSVVKAVLLSVLDALAHAHARGVVHRDIKPANVLISSREDARPGLKLTDFGIAHALGRFDGQEKQQSMGTPHYMAPEQFEANWRRFGPWTDLYALGCMAFELACGHVPYEGESFIQQAYLHLNAEIPRLRTLKPFPEGFEGWVRRLIQKRPRARFQRAADAAWALSRLSADWASETIPALMLPASLKRQGAAPEVVPLSASQMCLGSPSARDTPPLDFKTSAEATMIIPEDALIGVVGEEESPAGWADDTQESHPLDIFTLGPEEPEELDPAADTPPLRTDWRRAQPPGPSMKLVGAGLGLFGLRAVPLVGRGAERDELWRALYEVDAREEARIVLLRGTAGVGKSRLVEWICQRAHELGSATILKATHSPTPSPADGLPRMLARHLRCVGLSRDKLAVQVREMLAEQGVQSAYEWRALTELMSPSALESEDDPDAIRFNSPREWYVMIRRYIERLTESRPVILWFDDVQWGADSLDFARYLIDSPLSTQGPELVLMTARDDALAERTEERERVEALMAHPACRTLDVAPLMPAERALLVQELLGLEGDLAAQVEERSGGNPLFAVQLVGDWVARGVLEVGLRGFVLKKGEQAVLPDDLHQIWRTRLERLLEGAAQSASSSLELASLLGQEVDANEWEVVCTVAGIEPAWRVIERLMAHSLVKPTDKGWAFSHGMLRESVERLAQESGRWVRHHLVCGSALSEHTSQGLRGVAERVAKHFLAASALDAALEPLLRAARERLSLCQFKEADNLLAHRARALRDMNTPPSDDLWGQGAVLRSVVWRQQGRFEDAEGLARRVLQDARTYGWGEVLPLALHSLGKLARQRGDLPRTETFYQESRDLFERLGDRRSMAGSLVGLADVATQRGDLDGAEQLFAQALSIGEQGGDRTTATQCLQGLGRVARRRGAHDEAATLYLRAYRAAQSLGNRLGMAVCLNSLGDIERFQGRVEAAEASYSQAMALYDAIDSGESVFPRVNLGLSLLRRGRYAEAEPVLEAGRAIFEHTGRRGMLGFVHTALMACAGGLGDWQRFEHHCAEATEQLRAFSLIDPDVAWPAQTAGELASAASQHLLASSAYAIAQAQWRALNKPDKLAEIDEALARCKALMA